MSNRLTFNYISKEAKQTFNSWTNKQVAEFHLFNPNGLYQEIKAIHEELFELVENNVVPSGWLLAYYMDWEVKRINELTDKKRVSRTDIQVWLKMTREQIAKVRAKIDEVKKS